MTEVRLAVESDLESIRDCVRAAYEMYLPRMDREPAPMLADYRPLVDQATVHVIHDGDEVCGLIVTVPDEQGLFVENVAVHPGYQGKGIGRVLMTFAEQQACDKGLNSVYLYTNEVMAENLSFYAHLGFIETHRVTESGYKRIYLRKHLD